MDFDGIILTYNRKSKHHIIVKLKYYRIFFVYYYSFIKKHSLFDFFMVSNLKFPLHLYACARLLSKKKNLKKRDVKDDVFKKFPQIFMTSSLNLGQLISSILYILLVMNRNKT